MSECKDLTKGISSFDNLEICTLQFCLTSIYDEFIAKINIKIGQKTKSHIKKYKISI